jgi:hypothetical protein
MATNNTNRKADKMKRIALPEHPEIISNPNSCHVAIYAIRKNGEQGRRLERYPAGTHAAAVEEAKRLNSETSALTRAEREEWIELSERTNLSQYDRRRLNSLTRRLRRSNG